MIAVIYDEASGRILQVVRGDRASIEADPRPKLEVDAASDDFDVTLKVSGGQVVAVNG